MNPFSRVLGSIKDKVRDVVLGKVARDIAEGKHGPKLQAIYLWSRGKKTVTGLFLFLISGAVVSFDPPYAAGFFKVSAGLSAGLMGLGMLDASWNNKPAFPIWFIQSLQRVSAALTAFHAIALPLTELIHNVYPSGDSWLRRVELYEAAAFLACGYVNRYAAASLAPPPMVVPRTAITGEFSLSEVIAAVKAAPLVPERRLANLKPGIESDAAGKKER